jgi:hypothetical protein
MLQKAEAKTYREGMRVLQFPFPVVPDLRKRWFFPVASHRPYALLAGRWIRREGADAVLVRNLKLAEHLLRQPGLPPSSP